MDQTSTQSETPRRKLMIPLLVCVLGITVFLAWLMVRHARVASLQVGEKIIATLNTGGLDAYRQAQGEPDKTALFIFSRHAQTRFNDQPAVLQAQGWRFLYFSTYPAEVHEGLEIVINAQAAAQGVRYAGWYEAWTWNPKTLSGAYRAETLAATEPDLTFTTATTATFSDGQIVFDHDGLETTEPITAETRATFIPPAYVYPATLALSQEQAPVALLHMLRTTQMPNGQFITNVEQVCLTPADPAVAPREMGTVRWAASMKTPGTDLVETTFYFTDSGQLTGINDRGVLEIPYRGSSFSAPPANVLQIAEQVFIRTGRQESPATLTPEAIDPETDAGDDVESEVIGTDTE